ncbi:MAG: T9SS type A sorting domain-containing protein [Bacteroidetes bacterium]|nr:MAG: T9SS type A sorting domain-containing protein [Bacteroidota bacterium]
MLRSLYGVALYSLLLGGASAQSNTALSFSSSSSAHVVVPHTDTLKPAHVTVETWVNIAAWTGYPGIVGNTEFGGYELQLEQVSGEDRLHFWVYRNGSYGDAYITRTDFGTGWHHVAGTFDGRYTKIYLDGVLKMTNDAGIMTSIHYQYQNALIIGAEASSGNTPFGHYFSGSIDNVRIWNHARPADSIQAAMGRTMQGNEGGLVGCWEFSEGSGTITQDLTQYDQDGTLMNGPAWTVVTAPLPVELESFTAAKSGRKVELRWRTESEIDNLGFEVERRELNHRVIGSSDQWNNIAFVPGHGTTNVPQSYSYVDAAASGRVQYRLKQLDRDGSFSYSRSVEVELSAPAAFELAQNFPNPFNPSTSVSFTVPVTGHAALTVYNSIGQHVATLFDGIAESGMTYRQTFAAERLAGGVYLARLTAGSSVRTVKMLLLK